MSSIILYDQTFYVNVAGNLGAIYIIHIKQSSKNDKTFDLGYQKGHDQHYSKNPDIRN